MKTVTVHTLVASLIVALSAACLAADNLDRTVLPIREPEPKTITTLAPGKHTIRYEFIPDAAKPGTGGKSILSVDGKRVAEAQIPKTQPFAFSGDEGADVGLDAETNVSPDYEQNANAFTGKIIRVTVEVK